MKFRKCPNTITGKHYWKILGVNGQLFNEKGKKVNTNNIYKCVSCGLVDDSNLLSNLKERKI
jgi:hypothetical protein